MPMIDPQTAEIDVQTGDALVIAADVLALKSGTELYGVTNLVVDRLEEHSCSPRAEELQRRPVRHRCACSGSGRPLSGDQRPLSHGP